MSWVVIRGKVVLFWAFFRRGLRLGKVGHWYIGVLRLVR